LKIGNEITIKGIKFLKESFYKNRYLKIITFLDNKIEKDELFFYKSIFYNYTFEFFKTDFFMESIEFLLKRNINLHHYGFFNFNLNFDLKFFF
jgi:hypothetical protein